MAGDISATACNVDRCRGSSSTVDRERVGELRDVHRGDRPDLFRVDSVIVVGENDSQSDDVVPRHLGIPTGGVISEQVGGLADDLEQPLGGAA